MPPGLSGERLSRIDAAVRNAIADGDLRGAVVLVGRGDRVLFRRAYGRRSVFPAPERMTADTVFDVASLTKPVATALSILLLVEEGRVSLRDPVALHLPEFAPETGEREKVTVEHLLTHRAGLASDDPLEIYTGDRDSIFARKYRQPLEAPPGSRFVYSDVGYEVLGELVRRVSGERLDRFAARRIFRPLGMRETHFRPIASSPRVGESGTDPPPPLPVPIARIAPTERRGDRWMRGEVHDPRAFALGGVAGHAGLFSTADDLARFCRMILAGGRLGTARLLSPLGVDAMTRPRDFGDADLTGLGFDVATAYSRPRGDLFPIGSFGHTGFTGTSLWIDPSSKTFVVFLSNRVHPDGAGDVRRLRGVVGTIAAAAIGDDVRARARALSDRVPRRANVLAGVDVLVEDRFRHLSGKRVGLLTNATGRTRDGRSTAGVLRSPDAKRAGVELVRLFSPEHGIDSGADEPVADGTDPETGLPIVSLYPEPRRAPASGMLAGLDLVVVDLQDVGTRFYTYIATAVQLQLAAAREKIPFVVLDRPDPINGVAVEGPLADPDKLSFTAPHTIPVRYGMTPGELARMILEERKTGADVRVVRMRGWSRAAWHDETGLEWVNPSPNMRSLTAATLYPGVGLLETTNLSVGRGTDTPFEVIGAPWLDGARLARLLSARRIPGVRFTPVHFTPAASVFAGERCGGVRLTVENRDLLGAVRLGIEIATALRDLHPLEWNLDRFGGLLVHANSLERLRKGETAAAIVASWRDELQEFEKRRARYLLY